MAVTAKAAPYAAMVVDARSGEVIHSKNADTRLHPASLTKMMTLYITFEAIRLGEISPDTKVTISQNAAAEPPSKLGLKSGQKISIRYLIRAASVKSANDAATALGEAIEGSEAAFARRMNRTAKALGMTRSTFKNAHGLTEEGHLSTARDMTLLGRRLLYDYPEYYNLFSRRTADAGLREVSNTNRRLLDSYKGADGIKTGYTRAAGFNLVASAERGSERVIATVFGGQSSVSRNAEVARLLDLGFRKAPSNVAVNAPEFPQYAAGKTIRLTPAVAKSIRPVARPIRAPAPEMLLALMEDVGNSVSAARAEIADDTVAEIAAPADTDIISEAIEAQLAVAAIAAAPAVETAAPEAPASDIALAEVTPMPKPEVAPDTAPLTEEVLIAAVTGVPAPKAPKSRPAELIQIAAIATPHAFPKPEPQREIVVRASSSSGRHWGINIGRYNNQYLAERALLTMALQEIETLDEALRKVGRSSKGYEANFVAMTQDRAEMACRRILARAGTCTILRP